MRREQPLLANADGSSPPRSDRSELLVKVLKASGPAILNNVAAPTAAAVQLALLGHSKAHSAEWVAVWTAVTAVTTFVVGIAQCA